jgi:hypothetical protein
MLDGNFVITEDKIRSGDCLDYKLIQTTTAVENYSKET